MDAVSFELPPIPVHAETVISECVQLNFVVSIVDFNRDFQYSKLLVMGLMIPIKTKIFQFFSITSHVIIF